MIWPNPSLLSSFLLNVSCSAIQMRNHNWRENSEGSSRRTALMRERAGGRCRRRVGTNATICLVCCHGWGINTVCLNLPLYTSTTDAGWLPWQQVQHTKEVVFSFLLLQIHPDPAPNLFSLLLLLFNNLFFLSFLTSINTWQPQHLNSVALNESIEDESEATIYLRPPISS